MIKYTLTHIFNAHKNNVLSGVKMAMIKYQLFSYLHTIQTINLLDLTCD